MTEVIVAYLSFANASGTLKKVQKLVFGLLLETRVSFFFRVSHYEMLLSVHVEKFARPVRKDYVTGMG